MQKNILFTNQTFTNSTFMLTFNWCKVLKCNCTSARLSNAFSRHFSQCAFSRDFSPPCCFDKSKVSLHGVKSFRHFVYGFLCTQNLYTKNGLILHHLVQNKLLSKLEICWTTDLNMFGLNLLVTNKQAKARHLPSFLLQKSLDIHKSVYW